MLNFLLFKKCHPLLCLLSVTLPFGNVEIAFGFNLEEAFQRALSSNPAYLAEKEAHKQAVAEVKIRQGAFLPELDALGTLVIEDKRKFDGGPTVQTQPRSASLRLRQTIFSGGENSARFSEAKRRLYAADAALIAAEQTTLLSVAEAYLDVLLAREVLALNSFQVEVLQKQKEAAQKRFELGEVTQTDVAQAQARLAATKAARLASQGELLTKEAIFTEVIGIYPTKELLWPEDIVKTGPSTLESLEAKAYAQHPDIAEAVALLAAEKQAVKAARAGYYPDIGAEVSVSRREGAFSVLGNGSSDEFNATLNASFPLFKGGATVNSIRKAKAREQELNALYSQRRREIKRTLTEAFYMYKAAREELSSRKEATAANKLAYEGVKKETFLGARTTLDLLDAEQELLQAKVDEVSARHQKILGGFRLVAALGALRQENFTSEINVE